MRPGNLRFLMGFLLDHISRNDIIPWNKVWKFYWEKDPLVVTHVMPVVVGGIALSILFTVLTWSFIEALEDHLDVKNDPDPNFYKFFTHVLTLLMGGGMLYSFLYIKETSFFPHICAILGAIGTLIAILVTLLAASDICCRIINRYQRRFDRWVEGIVFLVEEVPPNEKIDMATEVHIRTLNSKKEYHLVFKSKPLIAVGSKVMFHSSWEIETNRTRKISGIEKLMAPVQIK